tara:strand:- start:35507 stop:35887 length:381 start_codon:yes stop_codon:yes gene_type:complete
MMYGFRRQLGVTVLAYVAGIVVAVLVLLSMIDINTISLESGLPTIAVTTPMIAVIVFWATARIAGAHIGPVRTFLFGGIAVYSLLYLCGALVASGFMSDVGATVLGAFALFILSFITVGSNLELKR